MFHHSTCKNSDIEISQQMRAEIDFENDKKYLFWWFSGVCDLEENEKMAREVLDILPYYMKK